MEPSDIKKLIERLRRLPPREILNELTDLDLDPATMAELEAALFDNDAPEDGAGSRVKK